MNPSSWPLIPVPEVATDPNGGTTVGVLPVFLFTNDKDQIRDIFAPDINWNTTLGAGGNFRYLSYPSEDTQWYVETGGQEKIQRQVDLDYETGRTHQNWWSFEGRFYFERDPTERFYGLGNHSAHGNQSNYTQQQLYGRALLGLNLTPNWQVSLMERPRWVRIQEGGFTNVPSIFSLFPHQKGINGGSEVLNQAMVSYDSRDSLELPRTGGLYRLYGGIADRRFLSSVSYTRFGGELRQYYSLNSWMTFAGHLFMEYEPADGEIPFWSAARLGGEASILTDQETLRGFGADRFIDNNETVLNAELRMRVWQANLFSTHGILELAPFFDIGRVGHTMGYNPLSQMHPVGGVGFRGIAEPFVVGYLDIGIGGEGVAIFTGINYPF
ncbi:MAG TPA: BamA/TamA family outer membrane protein [Candidatus Binataceae bacterium]|nr:BamA/TamA family outer membrane protein [Candidatus Binataceae bacterium]